MRKILFFAAALMAAVPASATENVEALRRGSEIWETFTAHTIDDYAGFASNPGTDRFGGWKAFELEATGWFRVAEYDGRWWYITPEGHPFLSMAVATVHPGTSNERKAACKEKFGSFEVWADSTVALFEKAGLNSMGCWTRTKFFTGKIPYTGTISSVKQFAARHGIVLDAGKDGAKAMKRILSDPEFRTLLEKKVAEAVEEVGDDPYCIGWFSDNELPWDKGHPELLEQYLKMVTEVLRKYDANRLYLGCRFNSWPRELSSPELLSVAGKYMDVISINHYSYWEPDFRHFDRICRWSGRPAMVTEFYAKGEDSGMKNSSGAGWIVRSQKDRGLFYQNFVLELLKSRACVGWQWFCYQDNDPFNRKADPSNLDSNKGIVDGGFNPYSELVSSMSALNGRAFALADSLHKRSIGGRVTDSETGRGIAGVAVSDGLEVVLTDSEGRYRFPVDDRRQLLCVTVPSRYEIPLDAVTGLPAHYGGPDFVLTPIAGGPKPFDIIAIGDPQTRSVRQLGKYVDETLADIRKNASDGTLAFALGDIVSDSDPTWEPMYKAVRNLKNENGDPIAYFSVMGNHDTDRYDDPVDSSVVRFEKYYGPRNFSIDRDGVHIVVLDDIFRTEPKTNKSVNGHTWKYRGGLSIEQYRWLLDDFSKVVDKKSKTLVVLCHIPFDAKNMKERRVQALNLFRQFGQVHILCGHKHITLNDIYDSFVCAGGTPVYSHTHVAAGGNVWWLGSVAFDGTPAGYGVYNFADGNIRNWYFKGTGMPASKQFAVYDGNDVYSLSDGTKVEWADSLKRAFVVDVWNDDAANWKVELYSGTRKIGDFRRVQGKCFHPVKLRTIKAEKGAQEWSRIDKWSGAYLNHLWVFVPKSGKPGSVRNWEVRVTHTVPGSGEVNVYRSNEFTE